MWFLDPVCFWGFCLLEPRWSFFRSDWDQRSSGSGRRVTSLMASAEIWAISLSGLWGYWAAAHRRHTAPPLFSTGTAHFDNRVKSQPGGVTSAAAALPDTSLHIIWDSHFLLNLLSGGMNTLHLFIESVVPFKIIITVTVTQGKRRPLPDKHSEWFPGDTNKKTSSHLHPSYKDCQISGHIPRQAVRGDTEVMKYGKEANPSLEVRFQRRRKSIDF